MASNAPLQTLAMAVSIDGSCGWFNTGSMWSAYHAEKVGLTLGKLKVVPKIQQDGGTEGTMLGSWLVGEDRATREVRERREYQISRYI